jgi:D-tyrosyl-tRNA(Tyr) deacylase
VKAVVQRVSQARVQAGGEITGAIGTGLLVLLGVGCGDTAEDADFLAEKIINLRIFEDDAGKMNLSLTQVGGELLVVSQFTLLGDCSRGRRPSFINAAPPGQAEALYDHFVHRTRAAGIRTATGRFRSMMEVSLTNSGPVTLVLESAR